MGGFGTAYCEYDEDAFGPEAVIVWDSPAKAIFDHKAHTVNFGLECGSCHDDLFEMEQGVALETDSFNMKSMADGNSCGACHDGDTAFAVDSSCSSCHPTPEDPVVWSEPVKAVVFYHDVHTEQYGLECISCHSGNFSMKNGAAPKAGDFTMESLYKGKYCGECHDGATAFASDTLCRTCHIGTKGYKRLVGEDNGSATSDH